MLEQDRRLAEALQAIQNESHGGGLVTSFVGIAEIAHSADPGLTGYMVFAQGTPAMRRGLLEELRNAIDQEIDRNRRGDI